MTPTHRWWTPCPVSVERILSISTIVAASRITVKANRVVGTPVQTYRDSLMGGQRSALAFSVKRGFSVNEQLRTFQRQFIRGALAPGIDVAALSLSRGATASLAGGSPTQAVSHSWG